MNRALSRDPAERYQSAAEMGASLRAFLSELGIEDPDDLFARYLRSPEGVSSELRQQSVDALLRMGATAAKNGDVPKAQAALSRVLAIDDGNHEALKLLGSLGARRRRGALLAGGAALVALLLGAFLYASWLDRQPASTATASPAPIAAPSDDTGVVEESNDAQPTEDSVDEAGPPAQEAGEVKEVKDTAVEAPQSIGPRWVVFKPVPPNVSISVDGAPPRAYGPDFQGARLKPGTHTFRFVGAEDCCEERRVRRRIPPGSRDYELAVRLAYKPARLYLKGPTPPGAKVQITLPGNRRITGRIREILRIPMSSLRASAQVEISAPGYRTYRSVIKLRAGGDPAQHSFRLERDKETP